MDLGETGGLGTSEDVQYEIRIANRFKMGKKIGSGSFGEIYLGLDI